MKKTSSNSLARVLETVCAGLLGIVMLNAAFEFVAWVLWQKSYAAVEEIQGVLVVWLGLLAAAYCLAEGLHLSVDLVARRLPAKWQGWLSRIPGVAAAAFGSLLLIFGARLVLAIENTLPGTGWSASIQYQPAVVAGALIAWLGLLQATGRSGRPKSTTTPAADRAQTRS